MRRRTDDEIREAIAAANGDTVLAAAGLDMDRGALKQRLRALGIPCNPLVRHVSDATLLATWERARNVRTVADLCRIADSTVEKRLRRLGVDTRSAGYAPRISDDAIRAAWDGTIAGTAAKLGTRYGLVAKRYRAAGLVLAPRVPPEVAERIAALYRRGDVSMHALAAKMGLSLAAVRDVLDRLGARRGHGGRIRLALDMLLPIARGEKTVKQVAAEHGLAYETVRQRYVYQREAIAAALGVPVGSLRDRPKNRRTT